MGAEITGTYHSTAFTNRAANWGPVQYGSASLPDSGNGIREARDAWQRWVCVLSTKQEPLARCQRLLSKLGD